MGRSTVVVGFVLSPKPRVTAFDRLCWKQIALPSAETLFMSITTVYFDSKEVYAGQYHKVCILLVASCKVTGHSHSFANQHPYGEINCVVPIDSTFELEGLPVGENWQGKTDKQTNTGQRNSQCASNVCSRCRMDLARSGHTPLSTVTRWERRCAFLPSKR